MAVATLFTPPDAGRARWRHGAAVPYRRRVVDGPLWLHPTTTPLSLMALAWLCAPDSGEARWRHGAAVPYRGLVVKGRRSASLRPATTPLSLTAWASLLDHPTKEPIQSANKSPPSPSKPTREYRTSNQRSRDRRFKCRPSMSEHFRTATKPHDVT